MYDRALRRIGVAAVLGVAACRYGYDVAPSFSDGAGASASSGAGASASGGAAAGSGALVAEAGNGAADGGDGSGTASGGDGSGTASGGDGSGTASGGAGGESAGPAGVEGGAGGEGGSGTPPDMTQCLQGTYAGHDYLLCKEQRTWADAKGGCVAAGMHLVQVDDASENAWLLSNANVPAGSLSQAWLGASDQGEEGVWRWTDGSTFWLGDRSGSAQNGAFANWYSREPNDVGGNEDCAVMETKAAAGDWYDFDCSWTRAYICEAP